MTRMITYLSGILIAIFTVTCSSNASERKAYKIVDEKGNVTYSQTPPTQAKSVQKVDISPANSGRGSNTESRDLRQQQSYNHSDNQIHNRQKSREDAEQQRITNLKAECNRNRGADCENPETLRLIEAQKIPGGRNFR